jgi:hypothetical protein
MPVRKRSLPDTLQTRYFVDDATTFLFVVLLILGALILIVAMAVSIFAALGLAAVPWFWIRLGVAILCLSAVVAQAGRLFIDYSHWADARAAAKGRAITWGQQVVSKN